MENLYEFFGISKTASKEEIKKAYRMKAKQTHPDQNGSRKEFEKTNKYYKVLMNPLLRQKYDETGTIDEPSGKRPNSYEVLATFFLETLQQIDLNDKYINILDKMKELAKHNLDHIIVLKKKAESDIENFKDIKKRIHVVNTKEHENIFDALIEGRIEQVNALLVAMNQDIELSEDIIKILKNFEYETDKKPEDSGHFSEMSGDSSSAAFNMLFEHIFRRNPF